MFVITTTTFGGDRSDLIRTNTTKCNRGDVNRVLTSEIGSRYLNEMKLEANGWEQLNVGDSCVRVYKDLEPYTQLVTSVSIFRVS